MTTDTRMDMIVGAFPSYGMSRCNARTMRDFAAPHGGDAQSRFREARAYEIDFSLLSANFNGLWASGLRLRDRFIREGREPRLYWVMVHSDIIPLTVGWVRVMYDEMQRMGAKVLSVVSPIKTPGGVTSTAVEDVSPWHPRKLSIQECLNLGPTWTQPDLLINTGLLMVDMREPWVENICFHIHDRIRRHPEGDPKGDWIVEVQPEDWDFSRQCRALGVPVFATTKVELIHYGMAPFANFAKKSTTHEESVD